MATQKPKESTQQAAKVKAPAKVDKRVRFLALGPKRVNKALKAIELVGNLANRGGYEYTEDEAAKIVVALAEAISAVEQRFERARPSKGDKFAF